MVEQLDGAAGRGRRRRWLWAVAAIVVAGTVFVLVWFQPQKLFMDETVVEEIPTAAAEDAKRGSDRTSDAPMRAPSSEPVELARGQLISLDHGTSGTVRVLELADGSQIVRLEGLDTDNGPDLFLYLTSNPADGEEGAFDDDFLNLGRLKGNQGDQNYDLPGGTSLERYATVVIWCDRFDSAFGAADLVQA